MPVNLVRDTHGHVLPALPHHLRPYQTHFATARFYTMSSISNAQTFLATYKQYKHDTEYIAGWLAETAHSLGRKIEEAGNVSSAPAKKGKGGKGKKSNKSADSRGGGEKNT